MYLDYILFSLHNLLTRTFYTVVHKYTLNCCVLSCLNLVFFYIYYAEYIYIYCVQLVLILEIYMILLAISSNNNQMWDYKLDSKLSFDFSLLIYVHYVVMFIQINKFRTTFFWKNIFIVNTSVLPLKILIPCTALSQICTPY